MIIPPSIPLIVLTVLILIITPPLALILILIIVAPILSLLLWLILIEPRHVLSLLYCLVPRFTLCAIVLSDECLKHSDYTRVSLAFSCCFGIIYIVLGVRSLI